VPAPVNFPTPDPFLPATDQGQQIHLRQLANAVRGIMDGKINAAFDFDLQTGAAVQTVVIDERVRPTSRILLTPIDDVAYTHFHAGTVRVLEANINLGTFTVDHLPYPDARSFRASMLS